jgi:hypothetical protein
MNVFTEMAEEWIRENTAPAATEHPQQIPNGPEIERAEPAEASLVTSDSPRAARSETIERYPGIPRPDPDAWREPVAEWLESECVRHWRCHSSVSSLHQAYSDWDVSHGFPPCNRETFGELLQEAGFLIAGELVSALILRADLDGLCGYPPYAKVLADVRPIRRSGFSAQCARVGLL